MNPGELRHLRKRLEEERDQLIAELRPIASPDPHLRGEWNSAYPAFAADASGSHASRDEEEDEVEEYEARLATEKSLESRLLEVTRALERMDHGAYGRCTRCGNEISKDRLDANPAAEFDLNHSV